MTLFAICNVFLLQLEMRILKESTCISVADICRCCVVFFSRVWFGALDYFNSGLLLLISKQNIEM